MPTTHPPIDGLQPLLDGDRAAIQDPYRIWQQLLDEAPVHREGSRLLLARNGDVRHVEQDAESRYAFTLDQSDYLRDWLAGLDADRTRDFHDYYGFMNLWLVRTSGEQHTRLRRLAHHAFTPRRVAQMSGAIERFATELVDELVEQDQPDLMDLAYRLPLYVIVDMLGCPASDRERIRDWS
jgi:cytochrome P450